MSRDARTVIIFNIPPNFGSSDLRRFFTTFAEAEKFECFHFKRRPENKLTGFKRECFVKGGGEASAENTVALAVLRLKDYLKPFLDYYHLRHWTDRKNEDLTSRCLCFPVLSSEADDGTTVSTAARSLVQLTNLSELRSPPNIAPLGNVGTPTSFFLQAINECRLSPKVIAKLGLDFQQSKRTFSQVAPPPNVTDGGSKKHNRVLLDRVRQSSSKLKTSSHKKAKVSGSNDITEDSSEEKLGDKQENSNSDLEYEEEEWDRHRALHNDVSARRVVDNIEDLNDQPGTKERLFEEKMEVTWDKGSSGLVFYTDAQFWREAEAQEEAEDADDWDVDTSEYFQEGAGDKDARDAASMRKFDDLYSGKRHESAFTAATTGGFEKHTKGIGRKLMETAGWKDGQGLGKNQQGRAQAVNSRGQQGRSGLGYFKSKSERKREYHPQPVIRDESQEEEEEKLIRISTIYDARPSANT